MKKRLNITISEDLIEKMKNYAVYQEKSISSIIEEHFEELLKSPSKLPQKMSLVEYVTTLPKVDLPEDFDYKEEYYKTKAKRYGLKDLF